jgi:ADP-ribose pyrophosphatase
MQESWQTLSEEEVDSNPWWTHMRRHFRRPDGKEGDYDHIQKCDAVVVVARDDEGRFVMVREYRYVLDQIGISVCAGGIDAGETPEEAAVREFLEETGYEAATWQSVGKCAGMPFLTNEWLHVFFATDLKKVGEHDDEIEEVLLMTAPEVDGAISNGEMWDSHAIAPWQMVKLHLGL